MESSTPENQQPVDQPIQPSPRVVTSKLFRPKVYFHNGKYEMMKRVSEREHVFLSKLLECGSVPAACKEAGITRMTAYRYKKRKHVQAYLDAMLEEKAKAEGVTIQMLMSNLHDGIRGFSTFSVSQMESLKLAAKILRPDSKQGGVNVNVQVNVESPFAGMTENDLADLMRQRMSAIPANKEET